MPSSPGYASRSREATRLTAEFRTLRLEDQVRDLELALSRVRAAALDVLRALPDDKGAALSRLRVEIGRGQHRAEVA